MSTTTFQLPAPASSSSKYCDKHPQERVIGVCSACLAIKLRTLVYSSAAFAPEILDNCRARSPLRNSPPVSINSPSHHHHPDQDCLQTIDEETESSAQEINNEGLLYGTLEASLTPVERSTEAELADNNSVHSKITVKQIFLSQDVVHPIEEEKASIHQDFSLISDVVINEEVRPINVEEAKPKANPYLRANKPIKCKRSKSLCAVRGESLIKLEQEAHAYESAATIKGDQSDPGAKKVTLRTLFQLDDEEKWRNRALLASDTPESERRMHRFSADHKPIEDEIGAGSICDAKTIEEAKDVHDNHSHSHRCVPSAATLSSSVCPSMPGKLKHSVLLNSLLCRKTGDDKKGSGSIRKPSQVNEASRTNFVRSFHEGGLTQASDDGGFIRATYIASESREALSRCRSKLERSVTRSSVSSSQPLSPPSLPHSVDMKSERKFNLTARALAAEFPFILRSSAEIAEATATICPSKTENSSASATQIEECKEAQGLSHDDSVAVAGDAPARLQLPTVEAKPALVVLSRPEEAHHLAHNAAVEWEIGEATDNGPFSVSTRKAPQDDDEEQAEMPLSDGDDSLSNSQADTTGITRANVEEADAAAAAEESGDGIPTYITVTEGSQEVPAAAVGCRSLSRSASSGKTAGQQGTNKVPEEFKKGGGVWEAYSSQSGKGVRRWPSSSRTGKIAPAQTGLLRFYLTPLRASGRTRFMATRRPPKRHFWPLIFV